MKKEALFDFQPPKSPKDTQITLCEFSQIKHIFKEYHYKGEHMGGGISYCFALSDGLISIGGAVFGALRQESKYSYLGKTTELRRLACIDEAGKNYESYFMSQMFKWLRKNTDIDAVVSYSDKSVGHKGTIYKASNFIEIGETAPSKHIFWNGIRYHPRSLTIDRPYSYKMREALKTGEAIEETGEPKKIFVFFLNKNKRKKYLEISENEDILEDKEDQ